MEIRALKHFIAGMHEAKAGDVINVPKTKAMRLIESGLAEAVELKEEETPPVAPVQQNTPPTKTAKGRAKQ